MNVLLIDNFDSFSFNLVDELEKRGVAVTVWRNDLDADEALAVAKAQPGPRMVWLSPGPGRPEDAGCSVTLARTAAEAHIPVFGVCLGHQAIVTAFGGEVGFAGEVVHGKAARIVHEGRGPLEALPQPTYVARYHSLAATKLPDELEVVATLAGRELPMAVLHRELPAFGVQFHPESILTPHGGPLVAAVLTWAQSWEGR